MEFQGIIDFLNSLAPWVVYVFSGLGMLVVVGIGIDAIIDDKIDGGFMKKILKLPVLGSFLEYITRFSPFNIREK